MNTNYIITGTNVRRQLYDSEIRTVIAFFEVKDAFEESKAVGLDDTLLALYSKYKGSLEFIKSNDSKYWIDRIEYDQYLKKQQNNKTLFIILFAAVFLCVILFICIVFISLLIGFGLAANVSARY